MCNLNYFGMATIVLQIFGCSSIDPMTYDRYLLSYPYPKQELCSIFQGHVFTKQRYMQCSVKTQWFVLVLIAATAFAFEVVMMPALVYHLLRKHKDDRDPTFVQTFGMFYGTYLTIVSAERAIFYFKKLQWTEFLLGVCNSVPPSVHVHLACICALQCLFVSNDCVEFFQKHFASKEISWPFCRYPAVHLGST